MSTSLTETGQWRDTYARLHRISDPRPSRFTNTGNDYTAWAARADQWATQQRLGHALAPLQSRADREGWEVS